MIGEGLIKYIIKNDLEQKYIGFKTEDGTIYFAEDIEIIDDSSFILTGIKEDDIDYNM